MTDFTLSGIVTDVDGTLIDTERVKMHAHELAVERFGGTWSDRYYLQFLGQSGERVSKGIVQVAKLACSSEEYRQSYLEAKEELGKDFSPHPWVGPFLYWAIMHEQLPIAFMSSGYKTAALEELIMQIFDAGKVPSSARLRVQIHGSDSELLPGGQKTAHAVGRIMDGLKIDRGHCLGLEDSMVGLRAFELANLGAIAFVQHSANREIELAESWLAAPGRIIMDSSDSWRQARAKLRL